jgi:hypothetical protein
MTSEKTGIRRAEIGSAIAVLLSVLAVVVSFYQARIAEKQAHASVWPYVTVGYNLSEVGDDRGFALTVDNDGLGPALIESVVLSVDGLPRTSWADVIAALGLQTGFMRSTSSVSGRVLPPDINRETTISAIRVSSLPEAKVFFHAIPRLKIDVCYCSVYEECWIAHFRALHVDKVARCVQAPLDFTD